MAGSGSGVIFTKNGRDVDITIFQGASISISMIFGGSATPINVTGYSARLQVRKDRNVNSPEIASFTPEEDRVEIGDADGLISFVMDADDSERLYPGSYVYDAEIIDPSGYVIKAMSGKCTIVGEVTA